MSYLLDTHVFLWWALEAEKLSSKATEILSSKEADIYVSVITAWEIAIKSNLGKLDLFPNAQEFFDRQCSGNNYRILPVGVNHAFATSNLPILHKDPFDRILIAQAVTNELTLISGDSFVRQYDVKVVW